MKEEEKSKDQLIEELKKLHRKIDGLKGAKTDYRRTRERLDQVQERLRTLMDNLPDHIYFKDRDSRFTRVSRALANWIGLSDPEQAIGKAADDFLAEEQARRARADDQEVMKTGKPLLRKMEKAVWLDGRETWVLTSKVPLKDRKGEIIGTCGISSDITEHKLDQEALTKEHMLLRTLIDNLPDYVFVKDPEGRFIMNNTAHLSALSAASGTAVSQEAALGKTDSDFLPEEITRRCQEDEQALLQSGRSLVNREERLIAPDGSLQWYLTTKAPMTDEAGRAIGLVGISHNITNRKRAEIKVKRQLQRFDALRRIDTAITASLDLRVTFSVLLDQVTNQLGIDAADILLLNPHTQTLEYAAQRGFHTSALRHTKLRLGEGYASRAALQRRIISISNLPKAMGQLQQAPLLAEEGFVAYFAAPLIAKGQVKGVLETFHRTPLEPDQDWLDFMETLAGQAAIAIDNAALFNQLQRSNMELALAYDTTLEGWAKALELRDMETQGHTRRVTEMTMRLAGVMGIPDGELVQVRRGALLHDIGKMAIPDSILRKPGSLTREEWETMSLHPQHAYEMLSQIDFLRAALNIPYCHHEKWDGSGYPRGIKGEQIPLEARIFAVVDVWDALRSDRPYSPAWPEDRVRQYLRQQAGEQFDPQVIETFMKLLEEMNEYSA